MGQDDASLADRLRCFVGITVVCAISSGVVAGLAFFVAAAPEVQRLWDSCMQQSRWIVSHTTANSASHQQRPAAIS